MHPYRRAALLMPHGSGRAHERQAGHLPERETVLPCRRMAAGDEASPGLRPLRSGLARGRTFPFMSDLCNQPVKRFWLWCLFTAAGGEDQTNCCAVFAGKQALP